LRLRLDIASIGYSLGDYRLTNGQLQTEHPDWNLDSITEKTGITQRFVAKHASALELAVHAARKVIGPEDIGEIDCVLAVTSTAPRAFPGIACHAQDALGLRTGVFAFDVNLGCSGFVYAYVTLAALVDSHVVKRPLLLCADTYTAFIDESDRSARPIFSDAAAAILFGDGLPVAVLDHDFGTDGRGAEHLFLPRRAEPGTESPVLHMGGAQVLMFTMSKVPESIRTVLGRNALETKDIDLFVFHQASKVVLDNLQRTMGLTEEQVFRNIDEFGNTVSCTIPICLKYLMESGRLRSGARVIMCGFGVGLSWATCLVRIG
jgi:3-oxoacyl-[acyl-carrier-protein] synthase III